VLVLYFALSSIRHCTFKKEFVSALPICMLFCKSMGPSMVAFLIEVYGRAKEADKFLMSQQPALKHTWNTMVASSFWDMRLLSIACAATDAEYQNRIILHDSALNLPVVARQPQPHPDPNYAPHSAARRVAAAQRLCVS